MRYIVTVLRENGQLRIFCEDRASALQYCTDYDILGSVVKLTEEEVDNGDNLRDMVDPTGMAKPRGAAQIISKCGQPDCPCAWLG